MSGVCGVLQRVCVLGGGGDDCLLLLDPGLVEAPRRSWHSSSVRLEDKLNRSIYWNIRCCRKSRLIMSNYFQPDQENPWYTRIYILYLNFCPHEIQIHCNSNAEHEMHPGTVTTQWKNGRNFQETLAKGHCLLLYILLFYLLLYGFCVCKHLKCPRNNFIF